MTFSVKNKFNPDKHIDTDYKPETSIVLRYRNALVSEETAEGFQYKEWLEKTSIREGSRVFPLLTYQGVDIYILDETSLMHTKTLKSIDGCVSIAKCKLKGYERVVFESGGNTGTALTEYGQRAGLETFLFMPEENIPYLNSKVFESKSAHLISVKNPSSVKQATRLFEKLGGLKHIPQPTWRYEASEYRGFFIFEYMIEKIKFNWLTQSVSAAFGPIGIYRVFQNFQRELGNPPRFLGIQQEANCPLYRAWKSKRGIETKELSSTRHLLSKVMYDFNPHTYGSYADLKNLLTETNGDLTTISHSEFNNFLESNFDGKNILNSLKDNGIEITEADGEIIEKTGLMALAGTLKEIINKRIERGSKVLCCLTSGIGEADGKAKPEFRISSLNDIARDLL